MMSWQDFTYLAEIVASVAVFVSLIFFETFIVLDQWRKISPGAESPGGANA